MVTILLCYPVFELLGSNIFFHPTNPNPILKASYYFFSGFWYAQHKTIPLLLSEAFDGRSALEVWNIQNIFCLVCFCVTGAHSRLLRNYDNSCSPPHIYSTEPRIWVSCATLHFIAVLVFRFTLCGPDDDLVVTIPSYPPLVYICLCDVCVSLVIKFRKWIEVG